MTKIIYHLGTGTYFGLDGDAYVIDTEVMSEPFTAELMDEEGDEIAVYWGKRIIDIVTDPEDN